ncbi:PfkB family carbohydrate kinase [Roseovarius sp. 2305UL8-3]|uniref:PfkB family carbohydrate kinase n=1 Tax=Roseovarius conchicola TaxID=3121636 RepID=UPI0035274D0F
MSDPSRILQLHGVIVDIIYNVDALPERGGEAIVTGFQTTPGGGFNAMVAASRMGAEVHYGGAIGTGPFGQMVTAALVDEGIRALQKPDPARDQGCCTVLIEPDGERSFVAHEGAEGHVSLNDLTALPQDDYPWKILSGYALHYPGSCPAFSNWLRGDTPITGLVFDPSPVAAALPQDALSAALSKATWVSANLTEAEILTGTKDPVEAGLILSKNRADGGAIVRIGAEGCVLALGEKAVHLPAHPVEAIDTNGAGDTHIGAFVAALALGKPPVDAARIANIAAALSTTRPGPATAPTRVEIARIEDIT